MSDPSAMLASGSPQGAPDAAAAPAPNGAFWLAVLGSGLLVGGLAVAFHVALDLVLQLRERFTAWAAPWGIAGALVLVAGSTAAVSLAVWLTARFAPQAAGSGIQQVEGVERGLLKLWPLAVTRIKFFAGVLGIGGGLLLGREGPTVQMGASLAEYLGQRCGFRDDARRLLLVVGAGAGLAGAFNAPLAGTLLVVEEFGCPLRPAIYLGTLLASVLTDVCVRFSLGQVAELAMPVALPPPLRLLAPVLLVGVMGGLLGAGFNACLVRLLTLVDRWKQRTPAWKLALPLGAVLGAVTWWIPDLPGGGTTFAAQVIAGGVAPSAALWLLPLSFVLTLCSYVAGAPGGIFAPLLVLGALMGLAFHGGCLLAFHPWAISMPVLAAAGMASLFVGIVRSPLTATVLLIEMTGSHAVVLPLAAASLAAYAVAEVLGSKPIYESLLERECARTAALHSHPPSR